VGAGCSQENVMWVNASQKEKYIACQAAGCFLLFTFNAFGSRPSCGKKKGKKKKKNIEIEELVPFMPRRRLERGKPQAAR
jgi:hypothetical protein